MTRIWLALLVFVCNSYLPVGAEDRVGGAMSSTRDTSGQSRETETLCENPYIRTYTPGSSTATTPSQRSSASTIRATRTPTSTSNPNRTVATARTQSSGKSYDFQDVVNSGGIKRTFIVHIPAGYNRARPMPVICAFHGLGMTSSMMMYLTNFNYYGDKQGFIAVYPMANGGRWDDGRNGGQGDIQFVSDMIAKLSSEVNVDQHKIYAAGMSNGGHFVQLLAGQSRQIAAIAVVSSSVMAGAASSAGGHRMPVILFLGTDDPLVPSSDPSHNATLGKLGDAVGLGGLGSLSEPLAKMGGLMTAEETVEFWCKNNGCSQSPYTVQMPDKDTNDGTKVTRSTYGGYGSEVVFYSIHGGGHSWPGSLVSIGAKDILGRTSLDINASELIADFFLHH